MADNVLPQRNRGFSKRIKTIRLASGSGGGLCPSSFAAVVMGFSIKHFLHIGDDSWS